MNNYLNYRFIFAKIAIASYVQMIIRWRYTEIGTLSVETFETLNFLPLNLLDYTFLLGLNDIDLERKY